MALLCMAVLGSLMSLQVLQTLPIAENGRPRPEDVELAEGYLSRFYNLNLKNQTNKIRRIRSESAMVEKIKQMQNFFGLRETGSLDAPTLDVMKEARCGVPDVDNFSFYPSRPKWRKKAITYAIARYTGGLKKEEVERSFRSALKVWSDVTPLKFTKVNHGGADIVLSFARGMHGDFFPFDGPRGVLAHAFQPGEGIGGDVHFDDDESWTGGKKGYSLFGVATHELGHSLGLTHSRDPSAIMYPTYKHHSNEQYSLSADDVQGIQTLYGKPERNVESHPSLDKCDPNFYFDAAATIENELVFFKKRRMWMRTTKATYWNRLREGQTSAYLPGITSSVDASYDIPARGEVYIFTGHQYWVVQRLKVKGRVGSINQYGFPSSVRQVDAAVHISEYGKTMFFVGELYYRYDERKRRMDTGFPRVIQTDWNGIPRTVDAAFKSYGSVFLLSGTKSYQYDLNQKRVVKIISGNSWLGC